MYQHSLAYPGRQDNLAMAAHYIATSGSSSDSINNNTSSSYNGTTNTATTIQTSSSPTGNDNNNIHNKFEFLYEPARYITAKNVSAIFQLFGYNYTDGEKVFNLLYDVIIKLKKERRQSSFDTNCHSPVELNVETCYSEELNSDGSMHEPIYDQVSGSGSSSSMYV